MKNNTKFWNNRTTTFHFEVFFSSTRFCLAPSNSTQNWKCNNNRAEKKPKKEDEKQQQRKNRCVVVADTKIETTLMDSLHNGLKRTDVETFVKESNVLSVNGNIVCSMYFMCLSALVKTRTVYTRKCLVLFEWIWDKCGREVNGEKLLNIGWFKRFSQLDVYSWCVGSWYTLVYWVLKKRPLTLTFTYRHMLRDLYEFLYINELRSLANIFRPARIYWVYSKIVVFLVRITFFFYVSPWIVNYIIVEKDNARAYMAIGLMAQEFTVVKS